MKNNWIQGLSGFLAISNSAFKSYMSDERSYRSALRLHKVNASLFQFLSDHINDWDELNRDVVQELFLHLSGWLAQFEYEASLKEYSEQDSFNWERWSSVEAYPQKINELVDQWESMNRT